MTFKIYFMNKSTFLLKISFFFLLSIILLIQGFPQKSNYSADITVGDYCWRDLNKNGIQDSGEPPMSGIGVGIYKSSDNALIDFTISDKNGHYKFSNNPDIIPGDYYLKFEIPSTFSSTTQNITSDELNSDIDQNGKTQVFTMTAGYQNNNIDAGFFVMPPVDCDSEVANECIESEVLCNIEDLNQFCNSMSPAWLQVPIPGCGSGYAFHNPSWFAFVAEDEQVSFIIHAFNCASGGANFGIQWGIYDDCNLQGPVILQCPCVEPGDIFVNLTDLMEGHTYYFFLDGCSGTMCTYWIEILSGSGKPNILGPKNFHCDTNTTDCDAICVGSEATIYLDDIYNALYYDWTINGIAKETTEKPELSTTFNESGQYKIYVFGYNDCNTGEIFSFNIDVKYSDEVKIDTSICDGDTIEIRGKKFFDEVFDYIYYVPNANPDSCAIKYIINVRKIFNKCDLNVCSGFKGLAVNLNPFMISADSIQVYYIDNSNVAGESKHNYFSNIAVLTDTLKIIDPNICESQNVKYYVDYFVGNEKIRDSLVLTVHPIPHINTDNIPSGYCLEDPDQLLELKTQCNDDSLHFRWIDNVTGTTGDSNIIKINNVLGYGNHKINIIITDSFTCSNDFEIDLPIYNSNMFTINEKDLCWKEPAKIFPVYNTDTTSLNLKYQWMWLDENLVRSSLPYFVINESDFDSYLTPGEHILCLQVTQNAENGFQCESNKCMSVFVKEPIDTTIIKSGNTLIAKESDAQYQWLNCYAGNTKIIGETSQSFSPIINGSYSLELTKNGCKDTTVCHVVILTGIIENTFGTDIKIYPNPTTGMINIDFNEELRDVELNLFDQLGKKLNIKSFKDNSKIIFDIDAPSGIYLLELKSADKRALVKVVKE